LPDLERLGSKRSSLWKPPAIQSISLATLAAKLRPQLGSWPETSTVTELIYNGLASNRLGRDHRKRS
jgi:hypothetical protein